MEDHIINETHHVTVNLESDLDISSNSESNTELNSILLENNNLLSKSNINLNKKLFEIFCKYDQATTSQRDDKIKIENYITENSILILKNTNLNKKLELLERLLLIKEALISSMKMSCESINLEYEQYIKITTQEKKQSLDKNLELENKINELNREIETQKRLKLCNICYKNTINTIFFPCGHITCCKECKDEIQINDNKCPLCRKDIAEVANIYLP